MTDAIKIEDFYSKPTKYQKIIQAAVQVRDAPFKYLSANPKVQNAIISSVLFILYNLYLGYCIVRKKDHGGYEITEFEWCDGLGFLIIITALVYLGLLYFQVLKPYLGPHFENGVSKPLGKLQCIEKCLKITQKSHFITFICTTHSHIIQLSKQKRISCQQTTISFKK